LAGQTGTVRQTPLPLHDELNCGGGGLLPDKMTFFQTHLRVSA
jgi:hypothetical protein